MQWSTVQSYLHQLRHQTFRSFQLWTYRLYFTAQVLSTSGTWVQLVAENWLVVRLGGSGLALGITTALQFLPLLLFGAYGGVFVDRWNKRRLLMVTQSASGALALLIGLLAWGGLLQIWMIWGATLLLGCINALDNPGRQAFTMEMVGPDRIANAVGLNNAVATSARAVGPALSSLLIVTFGIIPCFFVNAVSYVVVVISLRLMKPAELHVEPSVLRRPGQAVEGLRYVWHQPALRTALLMLLCVSLFAANFQVLLPLLASSTFHQGAALYGLCMSCLGIGSVTGSLVVASWRHLTVRRIALLSLLFGITNLVVALAPGLPFVFLALGFLGLFFSFFLVACSGYLQLNAGKGMRGRVMALYSVAFLGTAPLGGPVVGWIAQLFGPRAGFGLAALGCVAASGLIFHARKQTTPSSSKEEHSSSLL